MSLIDGLFDGQRAGCRIEYRVMVSGSVAGWRVVASGVLHSSVLKLILFNILISDKSSEVAYTLSKFAE